MEMDPVTLNATTAVICFRFYGKERKTEVISGMILRLT